MLIRLSLLWLSMVVPATLAVGIGGPVGLLPHAVFHPIYIAFLGTTIGLALWLRRGTTHRGIRVLALLVAGFSAVAIIGQLGEEIVVFGHGGMHAPDELLEEADHLSWAIVGMLGGLFPSMFVVTALSIVAGVFLLRRGDGRGWMALLPGALYVVDFVLAVAGFLFAQMYTTTLIGTVILTIVAVVTRDRPSALDTATLPARSRSVILTP
jgi:hypothetical protein